MAMLGIAVVVVTIIYYSYSKNFEDCVLFISVYQSLFLIFNAASLGFIWRIREGRIRIFSYAWALAMLLSVTSWISYYLFPAAPRVLTLKMNVGIYVSIIVLSLSYYAARSRKEKLELEMAAMQHELEMEKQRNLRLASEQQRKLLEIRAQELQQLDQMKSSFFANVSHELRTPLTLSETN